MSPTAVSWRGVRPIRAIVQSVWARAACSVLLVSVVVAQAGLGDVVGRLGDGELVLVGAAVGALVLAFAVGAERWRRLLEAVGLPRSYRSVLRVTLVGAFASNFLPGTVGGDAARVWLVGPGNRVPGLATVVVDRVSLFACSVLFGWILLPAASAPQSLVVALAAASLVAAAGVFAVTGAFGLTAHLGRRFGSRSETVGRDLAGAARAVVRSPRVVIVALALGLVYQSLVVGEVWLLAQAVSVEVPYAVLAVVTPPVLLLSVLPLSIGGFGVREVGYVALLAAVGVGTADAAVVSLLAGAVYAVASLPGAVGLIRRSALTESTRPDRSAGDAVPGPS